MSTEITSSMLDVDAATYSNRDEYVVPGPDFVWSIDDSLQLDPYAIQIYASVDAYSRYITRIYCGVTGLTAVSAMTQDQNSIPNGFDATTSNMNSSSQS